LTIFCADGEEPSAFIKGERFISCMGDSHLLKKDPVTWVTYTWILMEQEDR